jgi:lipoprotein-anchoring transpeptidase ErfK/SrfK
MDAAPLTSQNAVQGFELSIEQVTAATQTVLPDSVYSPLYIPTEAPVDPVVVLPADIPTQAPVEPPTQDQAVQGSDAPVPTSTPEPVDPSEPVPGDMPLETPTYPAEIPTSTPEIFEPPVQLAMDVIVDTPTSAYVAPTSSGQQNFPSAGNGVRWIDVDLSNQRVYAYEGDVMLNSFLVSTGTWLTPTVTGQYRIYVKYRSATMSGDDYYLPNVPYVMYFYKGYGLHGTYWHNNFGTPMSHGCVNLRTDDAGWLFNFASVGTLVNVHY